MGQSCRLTIPQQQQVDFLLTIPDLVPSTSTTEAIHLPTFLTTPASNILPRLRARSTRLLPLTRTILPTPATS